MRIRIGMTGPMRRARGFSLLELLIVLAITVVVSAVAAPKFTTLLATYRLKSTASSVAGILQQCRIASVRTNSAIQATSTMSGGRQQLYVDLNQDGQFTPGEPTVIMPQRVSLQTAGVPADATTNLSSVPTTFYTTAPRFNPRGLPCVMNGGVCKNVDATNKLVGFVYYLKSDNVLGQTQWASVTVTPAGRIKTWFYSGSQFQ